MEGACVPGAVLRGFGNSVGAGRKRAGGLAHAYWAANVPPPFLGFLTSSATLPEVPPPSRPPAATPCGRPRPLPAPPPSSPPPPPVVAPACNPDRGGFGARSRERGVVPGARPGYGRGSPASRSGQPESLSQLVPVPERSPQPSSAVRLAAAAPGAPPPPMAAEIQPKPLTRKPILLQRVEGSQEVVNMAVIVPKEEGVISVSEDRHSSSSRHCIIPVEVEEICLCVALFKNVAGIPLNTEHHSCRRWEACQSQSMKAWGAASLPVAIVNAGRGCLEEGVSSATDLWSGSGHRIAGAYPPLSFQNNREHLRSVQERSSHECFLRPLTPDTLTARPLAPGHK
ncbi:WD repeat and FYVE domain-containing protein 2 isoform X3 [Panthera uncia]|uniref:WD repeat and FYVE domain-containing protein 2 isoform X3 n=1 Tax=Panthera uncia TaxID=29064 RepID=UPI0020FFC26A|nr:WD repeat and FYVE domain-containing protein 2 isoform X3 [Panthera uncia]